MDLRIIKTRKNIRQAFLELRSKNALEKIKVTELCEIAMINKTTFYKHYQDIYELSEEIEDETLLSILDSFEQLDSLLTDPDGFIKGLYYTFKSNDGIIKILFSDRMDTLIDKVQKQLIIHYPSLSDMPEKVILQSFLLWGATHVLMELKYDEAVLLNTLSKVARHIINMIDVQAI